MLKDLNGKINCFLLCIPHCFFSCSSLNFHFSLKSWCSALFSFVSPFLVYSRDVFLIEGSCHQRSVCMKLFSKLRGQLTRWPFFTVLRNIPLWVKPVNSKSPHESECCLSLSFPWGESIPQKHKRQPVTGNHRVPQMSQSWLRRSDGSNRMIQDLHLSCVNDGLAGAWSHVPSAHMYQPPVCVKAGYISRGTPALLFQAASHFHSVIHSVDSYLFSWLLSCYEDDSERPRFLPALSRELERGRGQMLVSWLRLNPCLYQTHDFRIKRLSQWPHLPCFKNRRCVGVCGSGFSLRLFDTCCYGGKINKVNIQPEPSANLEISFLLAGKD